MTPASIDEWRRLCPELSIEGEGRAAPTPVDVDLALLKREGYLNISDVLPAALLARLRAGLARMHAAKVALGYTVIYDQIWQAYQAAGAILDAVLGPGHRVLPAFWAWHLVPAEESAGWPPHRDRGWARTVAEDGTPSSITVWLALTDATPLNGCIYMVPMHLDEARVMQRERPTPFIERPQDVRAVPATAGSVLLWNQGVLHWGGRASARAASPRLSCALELQRGDVPALAEPLYTLAEPPGFEDRLALAERQVRQYQHMLR